VDVRGSTTIAEQMNSVEFGRLMNRFFGVATDILIRTDALIDKVVGDGVVGLYFPGFAGPAYPSMAVKAAQDLLRAVGYGTPKGSWLPIGIGVHTGTAYVGTVSGPQGELTDLTVLGDAANVTARLASRAGPGEALLSEATYVATGPNLGELEQRKLELKGKSEVVQVRVLQVGAG
jgi:adenylate cyclase